MGSITNIINPLKNFFFTLILLTSFGKIQSSFASVVYEKGLKAGATLVITCEQLPPLPLPADYKIKPIKGATIGKPIMPAYIIYRFYLVPKGRKNPRIIHLKKIKTYPELTGRSETGKQPELNQVNEFYPGIVFVDGAVSDNTFIIVYRLGSALLADVIPLTGKDASKSVWKYPFNCIRVDNLPNAKNPPIVGTLCNGKITGSIKMGTLRIELVSGSSPDYHHLAFKWDGKDWKQVEGLPGVRRTEYMRAGDVF